MVLQSHKAQGLVRYLNAVHEARDELQSLQCRHPQWVDAAELGHQHRALGTALLWSIWITCSVRRIYVRLFIGIMESLLDRIVLGSDEHLPVTGALCWSHKVVGRRHMHWELPNINEWQPLGEMRETVFPPVEVLIAGIRYSWAVWAALLVVSLFNRHCFALEGVTGRP